jgi:hypothetical protein
MGFKWCRLGYYLVEVDGSGLWWWFAIYGSGGREVVIGVACIVEGGVG